MASDMETDDQQQQHNPLPPHDDQPTHMDVDGPFHGSLAPQLDAQPPNTHNGETWVDFLRQNGTDRGLGGGEGRREPEDEGEGEGEVEGVRRPSVPEGPISTLHLPRLDSLPRHDSLPRTDSLQEPLAHSLQLPRSTSSRPNSSSSRSSERKRRLTTAETPMRRPSSIRMHSSNPGGSSADPIHIDDSPGPSLPRNMSPLPPLPPQSRRESDLVLPPWQPDHEVSQCPVCSRQFTFLFRKHHCRKCGRVVCSSCSPHRITIPRQFIVHPPSDNFSSIDPNDDAMTAFGPFRNPALGGGEEVRVCNPCVPDPNFSPPPQYSPHLHAYAPSRRPSASIHAHSHPPPGQRSHRASSSVHNPPTHQSHHSRESGPSRRIVSYHQSTQSQDRWPTFTPSGNAHPPQYAHNTPPRRPSGIIYPHRQPAPTQRPGSPNPFFTPGPAPHLPPHPHAHRPRPRRQIAEEDECPICGLELPAKGPDGDDSARAAHVEECIAEHSASPAPRPSIGTATQTSASLPVQRTRGMSSAGAGSSSSNRHSHATRGMFVYTATEKDCVDDEGGEAECVICFEEFEAGDKLARLVCWCKFHETCIKQWWEKKGRGACPTHQLHE